jgi:uncharacterized protein (DUF433 family)
MLYWMAMTQLAESHLTVKEAAFVTGVGERIVNHEIDARIIPSQLSGGDRRIRGFDVLYLSAVRNVRDGLGQPFRRRLRNAIAKAAAEQAAEATVEHFHVLLQELEVGLLGAFSELQAARNDHIESRAEVLAGEPVIKGTRIAARHIADLVKRGASTAEIRDDFDLTDAQIRAAVVFDRVTPKRGRPMGRRQRTAHVSAA